MPTKATMIEDNEANNISYVGEGKRLYSELRNERIGLTKGRTSKKKKGNWLNIRKTNSFILKDVLL